MQLLSYLWTYAHTKIFHNFFAVKHNDIIAVYSGSNVFDLEKYVYTKLPSSQIASISETQEPSTARCTNHTSVIARHILKIRHGICSRIYYSFICFLDFFSHSPPLHDDMVMMCVWWIEGLRRVSMMNCVSSVWEMNFTKHFDAFATQRPVVWRMFDVNKFWFIESIAFYCKRCDLNKVLFIDSAVYDVASKSMSTEKIFIFCWFRWCLFGFVATMVV